jgi:hypothetical protein
VTIAGTNFGATQGTSTVTFNGIIESPSLLEQADFRTEAIWPLAQAQPTPLYLSASPAALDPEAPLTEGVISCGSTAR